MQTGSSVNGIDRALACAMALICSASAVSRRQPGRGEFRAEKASKSFWPPFHVISFCFFLNLMGAATAAQSLSSDRSDCAAQVQSFVDLVEALADEDLSPYQMRFRLPTIEAKDCDWDDLDAIARKRASLVEKGRNGPYMVYFFRYKHVEFAYVVDIKNRTISGSTQSWVLFRKD